jgi:hypothetical protein
MSKVRSTVNRPRFPRSGVSPSVGNYHNMEFCKIVLGVAFEATQSRIFEDSDSSELAEVLPDEASWLARRSLRESKRPGEVVKSPTKGEVGRTIKLPLRPQPWQKICAKTEQNSDYGRDAAVRDSI